MTDAPETAPPTRRRRSDARRSIEAIRTAARTVLGDRPDASMEDIATAAGVTRQTAYAHSASRAPLTPSPTEAAGAEPVAPTAPPRLDSLPPVDALRRYLDVGWQ